MLCYYEQRSLVCVLSIDKKSSHHYSVLVKEINEESYEPSSNPPFVVSSVYLANDMSNFKQLIADKFPILNEEYLIFIKALEKETTEKKARERAKSNQQRQKLRINPPKQTHTAINAAPKIGGKIKKESAKKYQQKNESKKKETPKERKKKKVSLTDKMEAPTKRKKNTTQPNASMTMSKQTDQSIQQVVQPFPQVTPLLMLLPPQQQFSQPFFAAPPLQYLAPNQIPPYNCSVPQFQENFCPICGTQLNNSIFHCVKCGHKHQ